MKIVNKINIDNYLLTILTRNNYININDDDDY